MQTPLFTDSSYRCAFRSRFLNWTAEDKRLRAYKTIKSNSKSEKLFLNFFLETNEIFCIGIVGVSITSIVSIVSNVRMVWHCK